MLKNVITVTFLFLLAAVFSSASYAQPTEIKGLKVAFDVESKTIKYTLPSPCLLRQYVRIKGGPVLSLGLWEVKQKGVQEDPIITFNDSRIDPKRTIYDFKAFHISEALNEKAAGQDGKNVAGLLGIEQDLAVDISMQKPRLGQYIHDYQKNIKKITIDIKGEKNGLYSLKAAVDDINCLFEKNISLPYLWEKDFTVFTKGLHKLYVEVRGGDKALGIERINIQVV